MQIYKIQARMHTHLSNRWSSGVIFKVRPEGWVGFSKVGRVGKEVVWRRESNLCKGSEVREV